MNKEIKLVSFDMWNTLLRGNPDFKKSRISILADAIGRGDDIELITKISKEADDELNILSDKTGQDANLTDRVKLIIKKIGKNPNDFDDNFYIGLRTKIIEVFTQLPPHFVEKETLSVIKTIKEKNIKIALLSNTGFIDGEGMRIGLKKLGLLDLVDYTLFSNEIGVAKPHPHIFKTLINKTGFLPQEIIHVGDNLEADFNGAWKAGISPLLFDPENKFGRKVTSIQSLIELPAILEQGKPLHYMGCALYSLRAEDGALLTINGGVFDSDQYSKFKYGDSEVGKIYGHQLAAKFINDYKEMFEEFKDETDLVITTSPYKGIVKGSSSIVRGFKNYLNQYLLTIGKKPAVDITILKKEMFEGDYGTFTEEQRKEIMQKNELYVMEGFVENKRLIIIDDVRITGSHEKNLVSFFSKKNIKEAFFLYVGTMDSQCAEKNPQIESEMNNTWVNNFERLKEIMDKKTFVLNARICKYILSYKNLEETKTFIKELDDYVIYNLYNGIIADEYASMPAYTDAFEIIYQELKERKIVEGKNFNLNS